jgi:hypothetical protein
MQTENNLEHLRDSLLVQLKSLQDGIEDNLSKIKNENIRDTLLMILERQDKLFEYYVDTREDILKKATTSAPPVIKKESKEGNAHTHCAELLAAMF